MTNITAILFLSTEDLEFCHKDSSAFTIKCDIYMHHFFPNREFKLGYNFTK